MEEIIRQYMAKIGAMGGKKHNAKKSNEQSFGIIVCANFIILFFFVKRFFFRGEKT